MLPPISRVLQFLSSLDLEKIPSISLGTAALLIFGAIASLAVLRGLLRILWGVIVLCLAAAAAFISWKNAPALAHELFDPPPGWFSPTVVIVTFLLAFFLLRSLGRFVARPLATPGDTAEKNRRSPVRWALTLLLSLIPTAIFWFSGATLLNHAGTVAELRSFAETAKHESVSDRTAFLARLRQDLAHAFPDNWFSTIDPVSDDLRLQLAKLIALADSDPPRAIPVLEENDIRGIILADPELRNLARQGRYAEILRDPRLDQMLENDNLSEVLQNADL